jgi:CheY-like chemotaxis protein
MRILVIDDDQTLLTSMAELLTGLGHEVLTSSGKTVPTLNADRPLDVVICDYDLGLAVDGLDVIAMLRQDHGDDVRYILYSGLDRKVPDGVEFHGKGNLQELLDTLT